MKMATTAEAKANYGNGNKHESRLLEEEEEESLLAEDLAHFGNVKNEFVIFGKLASYGLLREGRLEESVQVCGQVLAIDPRNDEMNRLKERLTRFQNTANGSQVLKEEFIKHTTESPIRKLRRSVSEIKSKKSNSFENGACVNGSVTISDGPENSHRSDSSKMRHTITNGTFPTGTAGTPEESKVGTPGSIKLGRSQSLGTKRVKSTSVLQKIQQFEQAAERRTSAGNARVERRASRKPSEDTVMEGKAVIHSNSRPDSGFQSRQSFEIETETFPAVHIKQEILSPVSPRQFGTRETESQISYIKQETRSPMSPRQFGTRESQIGFIKQEILSPVSPRQFGTRESQTSQSQPQSLVSPAKQPEHFKFSLPSEANGYAESSGNNDHTETANNPSKSPTVVKSNSITRKLSQQSETSELVNSASKVVIARKSRPGCNADWTDHGTKIFSDAVIQQLEMEFFNSDLIMRGCILSSEGHILGLTAGFRIKHYEIQTLLTGMMDASFLTSTRLTIGGIQYSCLSGTHTVVRARVKNRGVNCTKCKPVSAAATTSSSRLSSSNNVTNEGGMTIVVVYEHPVLPKEVALLVRSVGNILENAEENNCPFG